MSERARKAQLRDKAADARVMNEKEQMVSIHSRQKSAKGGFRGREI